MRPKTQSRLAAGALAASLLGSLPAARAIPISGQYQDDARCDAIPNQLLSHELGDTAFFPAVEAVVYHDHRYHLTVGVADDGIANDWTVHIENVSGQAWKDLFFVADHGATIGNADGQMQDLLLAPGVLTDAFHIDASGVNANLLSESISADGIFEPGEEWEFAVSNFGTGLNSVPPSLISPGQFAGSSQLTGFTGTNSSILASPVPEPATAGVIALTTLAMLLRRRRRWVVRALVDFAESN